MKQTASLQAKPRRAAADERANGAAQSSSVAELIHSSPRMTAQRRQMHALHRADPVQLKKYSPDGATYVNKTDEDVFPSAVLTHKGHLFTKDLGHEDERGDLLGKVTDAGQAIGADVAGSSWVTKSTEYDKDPPADKIDAFRVRIGGTYGGQEAVEGSEEVEAVEAVPATEMKLDYHFGGYNHGYVVKVADYGGRSARMEARGKSNSTALGVTPTYSNQHHDMGNSNLLGGSGTLGTTVKSSEQGYDSTTKLAGEGARFNCVREHMSNIADTSRFFTVRDDQSVQWVKFSDLWLTWSATFGKGFGIADATVKSKVRDDALLKIGLGGIGTAAVARGVGTRADITAGRDYNLDASRAASANDARLRQTVTIKDSKSRINASRKREVEKALNECDDVISYKGSNSGKSYTVVIYSDAVGSIDGAMPDEVAME